MKKRLFSIFLAVVMIATAINLAPVLEVWATGGGKMNNKYSLYDNDGAWDAGQYYYNDGDYSGIVSDYFEGDSTNTDDENFKTRHVTMFNDCDAYYNGSSELNGTNITRYHQIHYHKKDGNWVTNRNERFYIDDQTNTTKGKISDGGKLTANSGGTGYAFAPWLNHGEGCDVYYGESHNQNIDSDTQWARFNTTDKDSDMRMMFRNYNNSDFTTYNGYGYSETPGNRQPGMDISQYDWFEFDVQINDANWKKERSDGSSAYIVYFYYETNCGAAYYVDEEVNNTCIKGYNRANFRYDDQLFNDDGTLKVVAGSWTTIRLKIPLSIKDAKANYSTAPTVKQITIRMCGGNSGATSQAVFIDDLRFVKNDDHVGMVYTDKTRNINQNYSGQEYPSGKYFMINDFEYENDDSIDTYGGRNDADSNKSGDNFWKGTSGVVRPIKGAGGSSLKGGTIITDANDDNYKYSYPTYERAIRYEEVNSNDKFHNHIKSTSTDFNWGYKTPPNGTYNSYIAGPGIVTQGNYGTVLKTEGGITYHTNSGGWYFPTYYQRHYSKTMDLSEYTYYAIDVYFRQSIPKSNTSDAKGVTFTVQLFKQYDITNGKLANGNDHDDYNFVDGYSLKFFLPYGKDCWDASERNDTTGSYGRIIPLDTYRGKSGTGTSYGGMRFIFTREDLLKGSQTYNKETHNGVGKGETFGRYCLDEINGMRFCWLNQTENAKFDTYAGNSGVTGNFNIMLDNFIAYAPDTSITIQNVTPDLENSTLDGDQQYYVYDIYGGYSSEEPFLKSTGDLGTANLNIANFDGVNDILTSNIDRTVAVPVNGTATIKNLPFSSYYITQQNWSWRYQVDSISIEGDPYDSFSERRILKPYNKETSQNTAVILPRMSFDGTQKRNVCILDAMRQRHFTVTFTQKRTNTKWLDHNTADITMFWPNTAKDKQQGGKQ